MGQNQLIGWNHYEDQKAQTNGLVFRDVRTAPFQIHGLYRPETEPVFHRLPDDVARATSEGVAGLQYNTAGGRVRFRTDSQRVAIAAVLPGLRLMPHMTLTGANGFDLYETVSGEAQYVHSFQPATDRHDALTGVCGFPTKQMREFTLNFPLYNGVNALQIGLDADARLEAPAPYAVAVSYTHLDVYKRQWWCWSGFLCCWRSGIFSRFKS